MLYVLCCCSSNFTKNGPYKQTQTTDIQFKRLIRVKEGPVVNQAMADSGVQAGSVKRGTSSLTNASGERRAAIAHWI